MSYSEFVAAVLPAETLMMDENVKLACAARAHSCLYSKVVERPPKFGFPTVGGMCRSGVHQRVRMFPREVACTDS